MCAIFAKVWFHCAKKSISASNSSQAENPIKTWAIHTPTFNKARSIIMHSWYYYYTNLQSATTSGALSNQYKESPHFQQHYNVVSSMPFRALVDWDMYPHIPVVQKIQIPLSEQSTCILGTPASSYHRRTTKFHNLHNKHIN